MDDRVGELNSLPAAPVKSMNFRAVQVTPRSAPSNRPNIIIRKGEDTPKISVCVNQNPSIRLSVPHDCKLDLSCQRPKLYSSPRVSSATSGRPKGSVAKIRLFWLR